MSKFMRIIVFFDLPVMTKAQRKIATDFRKFMIDDGYYMIQFSVYGRLCNNFDNAQLHCRRLANYAPEEGSVRVMVVTEKQYANMYIVRGKVKCEEQKAEYYQLSFF